MPATLTTTLTIPSVSPSREATMGPSVRIYTLAWTSHTDGTVDLDTDIKIVGEVLRVSFSPGAGGVQPTDLHDIVIKDSAGVDILAGQGANLSNATASHVCPGVPHKDGTTTTTRPVAVSEVLNVEVSNAGSGKSGTIRLYVR